MSKQSNKDAQSERSQRISAGLAELYNIAACPVPELEYPQSFIKSVQEALNAEGLDAASTMLINMGENPTWASGLASALNNDGISATRVDIKRDKHSRLEACILVDTTPLDLEEKINALIPAHRDEAMSHNARHLRETLEGEIRDYTPEQQGKAVKLAIDALVELAKERDLPGFKGAKLETGRGRGRANAQDDAG
jgi:hypothetical protein